MDWEAIFHGSRRKISTVIIGCEADFRSRKRVSRDEVSKLIRRLKDHVNISYESETTIAKQMGGGRRNAERLAGRESETNSSIAAENSGLFGAAGGNERRDCACWLRADTGQ
jgi:hypothetical protein